MGDVEIEPASSAVLFTDPQVDMLKPDGVMWEKTGEQVQERDVIEKLVSLREAAREGTVPVFYSPHRYEDDEFESWEDLNPIERKMFDERMYDVEGEGSDIITELTPDDNTFVLSPHKHLSGFWANDVDIQLRKRGIDTIVLAGMAANLCVESHLRDAIENGYEVLVVEDATAAPSEGMLEAAQTNYGMIAHETAPTEEVTDRLSTAASWKSEPDADLDSE